MIGLSPKLPATLWTWSPLHQIVSYCLKTHPSVPPRVFSPGDCYGRRRWRQIQYMVDLFWKRWTNICPSYKKDKCGRGKQIILSKKIQYCPNHWHTTPRNSLIMGQVIETLPDSKRYARWVQVLTKTSTLCRPITNLALLFEAPVGV